MAPPAKDFKKRPKAKVGKRAPAKINATDTSFKTANVAVRSQDQSLGKNKYAPSNQGKDASLASVAARMELVSSRGNVLSTLQQSLRHHAPAVRSSGLKGIRDAVQSLSSLGEDIGSSILEANLPSLLPNMCRCWLDEDDDVRSLAISLFGDIITNLSSSSEQTDLKCMAPFVPFLCAYASSALNSLDRDIRKDGALIVRILASSDPSPSFTALSSSLEKNVGISAMSIEMGKHVDSFLPPLERLLSSMSLGGRGRNSAGSKTSGPKAKKQKREGNKSLQSTAQSSLTASDSTLLSLAFLLHSSLMGGNAISANRSNSNTNRRLDPSIQLSLDCTYLIGGSARSNSLSILRDDRIVHNDSHRPIRSIFDLPVTPQEKSPDSDSHDDIMLEEGIGLHNPSGDETTNIDKMQQLTSLLEILRSKFVELLHSGRKHSNEKDGIMIPTSELETLDVLVHIIRFVHRRHQSQLTPADKQYTSMSKSTNSMPSQRKKHVRRQVQMFKTWESVLQHMGLLLTRH
jgi:pre-rRNA-processing protein IPI1